MWILKLLINEIYSYGILLLFLVIPIQTLFIKNWILRILNFVILYILLGLFLIYTVAVPYIGYSLILLYVGGIFLTFLIFINVFNTHLFDLKLEEINPMKYFMVLFFFLIPFQSFNKLLNNLFTMKGNLALAITNKGPFKESIAGLLGEHLAVSENLFILGLLLLIVTVGLVVIIYNLESIFKKKIKKKYYKKKKNEAISNKKGMEID